MYRKSAAIGLLALFCGCAVRQYYGRGLVLEVNPPMKTITVSHDAIPGFMDTMVMPFSVREPSLLEGLLPGTPIYFRLSVGKEESYLDYLRILAEPPPQPRLTAGAGLSLGESVPDFRLIDQEGRPVVLSDFRGKIVAITFIYTRCPLPDYCPRMTGNFLSLRRRFGNVLGEDLILLIVTFDPLFDTSEVLKAYARSSGAEARGWYFLTGSRTEIERVCGYFGVRYYPDEGAITHNLNTGVIDRVGRLVANVGGKEYSSRQLGDLIDQFLER